ncbi:MAG: zinc-ribbon domain-containing protein [Ignavibacteriae bacterium]|nr:MAG: zinc-ribbon domain-containing protein [Ignavibacteriota bacterium]
MTDTIYYCENCGAEVSEHDVVCPQCGLELMDTESSEAEAFTTVVKTYDTLIDANVAKDILKDEGIESFLSDTNHNTAYPSSLFNETVYLFVMEKDFVKAFEILEAYDKANPGEGFLSSESSESSESL